MKQTISLLYDNDELSIPALSKKYNLTQKEVKSILKEFNVSLRFRKLSVEEYNIIKNEYTSTITNVKPLSKKYKIAPDILYDKFRKDGILKKNKFVYNTDYFKLINTSEKAYWLGFLYADGYIDAPDNKLVVELKYDDRFHLDRLINILSPGKKWKTKTVIKNGKKYKSAFVYFNSPEIIKNLINLGCTGKKSLTLSFPSDSFLPKKFIWHFIRGYFDGDGSIFPIKDRKGCYVEFCGTYNFLDDLQNFFENTINSYKRVAINPKGNAYVFRKGGYFVSLSILKNMYSKSNITLGRKKDIYSNNY